MPNYHTALALVIALVLSVGGCTKQMECSDTIDAMNAAVARMEKLEATIDSDDPADVLKDAAAFKKLAEEEAANVRKLEITEPELKKLVTGYIKMLDDTAMAAGAVESGVKRMLALESKTSELEKAINNAGEALGAACTMPAPGCKGLEKIVDSSPDENLEDSLFIKQLEGIKKQLVALKVKKGKVTKARDAFLKMTETQLAIFAEMAAAEKELDGAILGMDKATEVEDGLVDEINAFCGAI